MVLRMDTGGPPADPDRLRPASSFGAAADAYAKPLPDYAQGAVELAMEPGAGSKVVLDRGAGTGKLTGMLTAAGFDVTAVEPDASMLAELRRSLVGVRAVRGSAESIPIPDACVDTVTAGNAMHWFDLAIAGPEIARVLTPGGMFAGLWNVLDDRVGRVADLAGVAGSEAIGRRDTSSARQVEMGTDYLRKDGSGVHFGSHVQAAFAHGYRRTADSLLTTLATRAGMLVISPNAKRARLDWIGDLLAGRLRPADGEFVLPMLTCVLRIRKFPACPGHE